MSNPLRLDDFRFLARIGKGQFGKVGEPRSCDCSSRDDIEPDHFLVQVDAVRFVGNGETYALKTIDKSKITRVGQASYLSLTPRDQY